MIFEGKTFEEAVEKGLRHYNITKEQAVITLIKQGKNMFGVNMGGFEVRIVPSDEFKVKVDGFFKLLYEEDGVYMDVYPPTGSGEKLNLDDVRSRLDYKRVIDVDMGAVMEAIASAQQDVFKIAPPQQEFVYDERLIVEVAPDSLSAFMTLVPPDGGKLLTVEDTVDILLQNGVVACLDHENIRKVIEGRIYNRPVSAASAVQPVDGKDGYVDYKIDIKKDNRPTILDDGTVDFRELGLIQNVTTGQVLAELIEPTEGKDGQDVRGNTIKAKPGKPAKLFKGTNTDLNKDGTMLVSLIDGQVNQINGKINVYQIYEVPGNVDNSTGNIRFVGKVLVKGNVLTGFEIEAEGDIEVNGVVEGAVLKSGGNIILKRGVQGAGRGILVCQGNLLSKFIENCTVEAEGDIMADAIMHSKVSSKGSIEVKGRKGLIVGGNIVAGREIIAKIIGSPMATLTRLEVGVDPELRRNLEKFHKDIEEDRKSLQQINQTIELIAKMAQRGRVAADKKILLSRCINTKAKLEESIREKDAEFSLLKAQFEMISKGKIAVREVVYPGTSIYIGSAGTYIKDQMQYVTFYRAEGEIKIASYE